MNYPFLFFKKEIGKNIPIIDRKASNEFIKLSFTQQPQQFQLLPEHLLANQLPQHMNG